MSERKAQTMKFQHLAETYRETFEKNFDGKRVMSQATNMDVILAQHPDWRRDQWAGYENYAQERCMGATHDAAMASTEKMIQWQNR
jgi:hypothetical protein